MSDASRVIRPMEKAIRQILDHRFFIVLLVLASAVGAVIISEVVYPNLSWNRDEPVFLWQADLLLDGQLTQTDGGFPSAFHPWLSAHRDGKFFGQYPLGWPAIIAVGKLFAFPAIAPAAGSA